MEVFTPCKVPRPALLFLFGDRKTSFFTATLNVRQNDSERIEEIVAYRTTQEVDVTTLRVPRITEIGSCTLSKHPF